VEQGILSFWRGNSAMIYRSCLFSFSNIYLYAKLTSLENNSNPFMTSLALSTLNTILLYPLDLVHCHMGSDMSVGKGVIEDEGTL
jgi:hypothetical protein